MERWEEIDPGEASAGINLSGENVCGEVVPVNEPLMPEHVQHIEHRGAILQLLGGRGEGRCGRGRHCGGSSPFEGARRSGKASEGGRHKGMVVVRCTDVVHQKDDVEFINNQWYHIFWSYSLKSYYTKKDQIISEPVTAT